MLNIIPGVRLHCSSSSIVDRSSGQSEVAPSCELVISGQSLLTIVQEKETPEVTLKAGEYTELSDDGTVVIAGCYGYPRITVTKQDETSTICASLVPLIEISEDGMEVRLNLFPASPEQDNHDIEIVLQALKKQGVVYGIARHAIQTILDKLVEEGQPQLERIVARGKARNNGKNAYLRFEVEIGPLPGKLLADGSIDFRERLMFVGVKKDQLLACKIPATQGHPGMTVIGDRVDPIAGEDLAVKVSDDTYYSEDDGTIRATASGVLTVVGDDTLRVCAKQKISGDIDYHTGNIRSNNCVEITGTVQPGFMVSAKSNVSIEGNIQSAQVNSHGNIVIKGGVIGSKSQVRCEGDADIHHIEKGLLVAGGNIIIRTGAYYSSMQAGGNIHCLENVKIVGGDVVAGGSLSCGQIGTSTSVPMTLAVGAHPKRYRRYQRLQQEYHDVLQEAQDWYNRHGRTQQATQSVLDLQSRVCAIEQELSTLNIIPHSPEDSLENRMFCYSQASITVHDGIASGTIVRIGNSTMVVDHDLDCCIIKIDPQNGEFSFDPL